MKIYNNDNERKENNSKRSESNEKAKMKAKGQ